MHPTIEQVEANIERLIPKITDLRPKLAQAERDHAAQCELVEQAEHEARDAWEAREAAINELELIDAAIVGHDGGEGLSKLAADRGTASARIQAFNARFEGKKSAVATAKGAALAAEVQVATYRCEMHLAYMGKLNAELHKIALVSGRDYVDRMREIQLHSEEANRAGHAKRLLTGEQPQAIGRFGRTDFADADDVVKVLKDVMDTAKNEIHTARNRREVLPWLTRSAKNAVDAISDRGVIR